MYFKFQVFFLFYVCVRSNYWIIRINLLHSRAILLRGRTGCYQRVCRNRNIWSIQGGNAFQLRLDNPKIDRKRLINISLSISLVQVFFFNDISILRNETYAFDFVVAFVAAWRDETFETIFAVELSLLFYESDIL